MEKKLKTNKAQCRKCSDIIISTHRHHFISCKCGEIFTDGGLDYVRRGAKDLNNIINLCEYTEETDTEWVE